MTQEEESIKYVLKYERSQGRKPIDVSKKRLGYDVKSGRRYIEVKSRPGKNIQQFILLHNHLLRSIGRGLANYYLYIIYDMEQEPKLVIVPPSVVLKNLETNVQLLVRKRVYGKIEPVNLKKR